LHLIDQVEENQGDFDTTSFTEQQAPAYVAGWIGRKLLKTTNCEECQKCVSTDVLGPEHSYTQLREFDSEKPSLLYANSNLTTALHCAIQCLERDIYPVMHSADLCLIAKAQMSLP